MKRNNIFCANTTGLFLSLGRTFYRLPRAQGVSKLMLPAPPSNPRSNVLRLYLKRQGCQGGAPGYLLRLFLNRQGCQIVERTLKNKAICQTERPEVKKGGSGCPGQQLIHFVTPCTGHNELYDTACVRAITLILNEFPQFSSSLRWLRCTWWQHFFLHWKFQHCTQKRSENLLTEKRKKW